MFILVVGSRSGCWGLTGNRYEMACLQATMVAHSDQQSKSKLIRGIWDIMGDVNAYTPLYWKRWDLLECFQLKEFIFLDLKGGFFLLCWYFSLNWLILNLYFRDVNIFRNNFLLQLSILLSIRVVPGSYLYIPIQHLRKKSSTSSNFVLIAFIRIKLRNSCRIFSGSFSFFMFLYFAFPITHRKKVECNKSLSQHMLFDKKKKHDLF